MFYIIIKQNKNNVKTKAIPKNQNQNKTNEPNHTSSCLWHNHTEKLVLVTLKHNN